MTQYIDKSAVSAEINRRLEVLSKDRDFNYLQIKELKALLSSIDDLEVKEVEDDSLEKFKSLQHISGDLKSTLHYLGYAPNLYHFDGSWHVDWISCEEGDSIKGFNADTPEKAIDKAYNWFHSTFCNG